MQLSHNNKITLYNLYTLFVSKKKICIDMAGFCFPMNIPLPIVLFKDFIKINFVLKIFSNNYTILKQKLPLLIA
jgi:hypothetical protein